MSESSGAACWITTRTKWLRRRRSPLWAARPGSPCIRPTRSKLIRPAVHHRDGPKPSIISPNYWRTPDEIESRRRIMGAAANLVTEPADRVLKIERVFDAPRSLVFKALTEAQGNPTRPETTLTLLLEDVGGKTRLTLHNAIFESSTARDMHNSGWSSSLDCLGEYLATVR